MLLPSRHVWPTFQAPVRRCKLAAASSCGCLVYVTFSSPGCTELIWSLRYILVHTYQHNCSGSSIYTRIRATSPFLICVTGWHVPSPPGDLWDCQQNFSFLDTGPWSVIPLSCDVITSGLSFLVKQPVLLVPDRYLGPSQELS